jgi:putative YphP/YqiW family bacilliredoxin
MLVQPMREELTRLGIQELTSAEQVDTFMGDRSGTTMVVVNSVCGCAAGNARPAVALAMQHATNLPDRIATVFAGQDVEATARARGYFADFPPSSPSVVLFKDGEIVHFLPRHRIESRDAMSIAQELATVFQKHCSPVTSR